MLTCLQQHLDLTDMTLQMLALTPPVGSTEQQPLVIQLHMDRQSGPDPAEIPLPLNTTRFLAFLASNNSFPSPPSSLEELVTPSALHKDYL